ncbi:MAG: pyrroline-5-carboxylate reductase [Gemmatimonadota bacterium]
MSKHDAQTRIAILGGGNLGQALARGWAAKAGFDPAAITVTRRDPEKLKSLIKEGFAVTSDNAAAVAAADIVVLAVQPQQLDGLCAELKEAIDPERHAIISVVSGVMIADLQERLDTRAPTVRAMPNTAVSIGESMTCLAAGDEASEALDQAQTLFSALGETLILPESMMTPATAVCACGVAFFLRCVRAASQGGIEIGFHPEEALLLAAQTARGAASLLLEGEGHPEREIDRVTTPRGCTIAGLNEMEHRGFSSAMIRGIVVSAQKAEGLASG